MRLSAEAAHDSKYSQVQWHVLGHVQYWIEKGEWGLEWGLGHSECCTGFRGVFCMPDVCEGEGNRDGRGDSCLVLGKHLKVTHV